MTDRPDDIVSPITDEIVPPKAKLEEARASGRVGYDKPTPQNSVLLLVDHQIGLMAGIRDFPTLATYKANVIALAKMARALEIPTLVTSSNAQWQNGDTLPEGKVSEGDAGWRSLIRPPPRAASRSLRSAEKSRERRRCIRRSAVATISRGQRPAWRRAALRKAPKRRK